MALSSYSRRRVERPEDFLRLRVLRVESIQTTVFRLLEGIAVLLEGNPHELASGANARFTEQLLDGVLDGAFGDFHLRGDFLVRKPLHQ